MPYMESIRTLGKGELKKQLTSQLNRAAMRLGVHPNSVYRGHGDEFYTFTQEGLRFVTVDTSRASRTADAGCAGGGREK